MSMARVVILAVVLEGRLVSGSAVVSSRGQMRVRTGSEATAARLIERSSSMRWPV
jgi:hypothetical protein